MMVWLQSSLQPQQMDKRGRPERGKLHMPGSCPRHWGL